MCKDQYCKELYRLKTVELEMNLRIVLFLSLEKLFNSPPLLIVSSPALTNANSIIHRHVHCAKRDHEVAHEEDTRNLIRGDISAEYYC